MCMHRSDEPEGRREEKVRVRALRAGLLPLGDNKLGHWALGFRP